MARWQIGYATDCKSVKVGSIPARASTRLLLLSKALYLCALSSCFIFIATHPCLLERVNTDIIVPLSVY